LDFRKAFDRVDHGILLQKLAMVGVPDFLVNWIRSFLTQRQQRVKHGDVKSSWSTLKGGVPQGTKHGPTGFLLHINDLQTVCNSLKYVDDSSIWESCNISGENSKLQEATDQAYSWSQENKMQLNQDKTKEMVIGFSKKACDIPPLTINGSQIERVKSTTLLGVTLMDNLSWEAHINKICTKGFQRIYFLCLLRRTGVCPDDILQVYTSVVRPTVEYACEVWHTHLTVEQDNALEQIQRRALSIVHPDMSYKQALDMSKLSTLKQRREDLCRNFFKAMQGKQHRSHNLLPLERPKVMVLRKRTKYPLPKIRTERCKKTLVNYGLFNFQ
jgi:hypothetical protein